MDLYIRNTLFELEKLGKRVGGSFSRKLGEKARKLNIIAPIGNESGQFEKDGRVFIKILCGKITQRLHNEDIITNLAIFNLTEASEEAHYGDGQIIELAHYYDFDEEELLEEWRDLKSVFLTNNFAKDSLTIKSICHQLFKMEATAGNRFPGIKKLICFAATLPVSNAEVERTFSQLKLILTDNRNKLKVETVHKLMMIKINDNDDHNYVVEAAKRWKRNKYRRLF